MHMKRFCVCVCVCVCVYIYKLHDSVHHNSIVIKIQLDATVCSLIYFTAKSLYMFRVSTAPIIRSTKTVASGTGRNIGTATSLQRGQAGSPDLAMLEGSSCTDIMTYTGGCGYSFWYS